MPAPTFPLVAWGTADDISGAEVLTPPPKVMESRGE